MVLIPIGLIVSFVVYFFGILGSIAFLELISKEISKLIPFLDKLNITYYIPILLICSIILAISLSRFSVKTKWNDEAKYYRKPWQQILEIFGLLIICYFLFNHTINKFILGTKQNTILFFIGISVIYIISFSHFFTNYISSNFDYYCDKIVTVIKNICITYIIIALLFMYGFLIYLHDFVIITNFALSLVYFGVILLITLFGSGFAYSILLDYSKKNDRFNIIEFIIFVVSLVLLGFSPVYNTFINNKSLFSIYTFLTINIGILSLLLIIKSLVLIARKKT